MINNIYLNNYKGINNITIRNLSRINIFCGKNNSGKSTILEAISNNAIRNEFNIVNNKFIDEISIIYESLSVDRINYINKSIIDSFFNIKFNDINRLNIRNILENIFNNVLNVFNYLHNIEHYENFEESMIRPSDEFQCKSIISHLTDKILSYSLKNNYEEVIIIIIPSIRQLDLNSKYSSWDGKIDYSGRGIINKLFLFQNKLDNSKEKRLFNEIKRSFNEVTEGCDFSITIQGEKSDKICLKFSNDNDQWIDGNDCGLGLQDVLVILYFCIVNEDKIIIIEEPENHLHPQIQRNLLNFIASQNKQYFISTHSNIFLDLSVVDKVYQISYVNNNIEINDETKKAEVLNHLGYTVADNIASDIIILVEGVSDIPVIREFLIKMDIYHKYNVSMWPMGGETMSQIDLNIFNHHNIIAVIDNDPGSDRSKFIKNCKMYNIEVFTLKRYAIENYFSIKALKKIFPEIILENIDPHKKLQNQININVKKNNREIVKLMDLEEIIHADLYEFLIKVKERLEKQR